MLYLDTHIVLWLVAGKLQRLSRRARSRIDTAEDIRISPMVMLELAYLYESGRSRPSAEHAFQHLAVQIGLGLCDQPFSRVVGQACQIAWTRDAFDRIIVAQAMLSEAPLITRDERIRANYPGAEW